MQRLNFCLLRPLPNWPCHFHFVAAEKISRSKSKEVGSNTVSVIVIHILPCVDLQ